MWYLELVSLSGQWRPQKTLTEPHVRSKLGRPDRLGNDIGPRIRAVAEIHPDHAALSLDELAQVYGPAGRFYGTRPIRAANGTWTTPPRPATGSTGGT
jgi:hypothetical protein